MTTTIAKKTKTTPNIILDNITNDLIIEGRSISLDSELFWSFVINNLKGHIINTIRIKIDYINSRSTKYLPLLFRLDCEGIVWEYESFDDEMLELGQIFKRFNDNLTLLEVNQEELAFA